MKTLKESILNRNNHNGEGFKAQRRNEIEKWLKEYDIENYTINKDFTIDVNGNVNLFKKNLTEFPDYIQFGVVRGNFVCTDNNLTSLRGVPRVVSRGFYCDINKLTSLEGAPEKVGEKFDCNYTQLSSLEGVPKEVGVSFYCTRNKLTSLKGAPEEVGGDFYCSNNKVRFTEDDVRRVCNVRKEVYCYY